MIDAPEDKHKFEILYTKYRGLMFYIANQILSNKQDAEDAVHNAFLGIAKHIDILLSADESKGRCYCIKAAKNAALNIARKNSRTDSAVSIEDMYDVADEKSFEELIEKSEYEEVLDVIRNMDETYRDTLYLRYVMDMPVKKIAQVLERKESTVKQQLVRGKKMLINSLSREVVTADGK